MQAQDAVALSRERVPYAVGQRVEPGRPQDLPHGEAATSRVEARVLVCVGDDGDRGGVGGFYPAKGQELADRAQLPGEFPDPRLAGMAPDFFPTSP